MHELWYLKNDINFNQSATCNEWRILTCCFLSRFLSSPVLATAFHRSYQIKQCSLSENSNCFFFFFCRASIDKWKKQISLNRENPSWLRETPLVEKYIFSAMPSFLCVHCTCPCAVAVEKKLVNIGTYRIHQFYFITQEEHIKNKKNKAIWKYN